MEISELTTKEKILAAAEQEFIEKGYAGAKTTIIAAKAEVTHAMLHYYFGTKEKLFNMVFEKKIEQISSSITTNFDENLPFLDKARSILSAHFDFLASNPKLIPLAYNEIASNENRHEMLKNVLLPKITAKFKDLKQELDAEIKAGRIRPINPAELLLNAVALNIISFMAAPILNIFDNEMATKFIEHRKENVIKFVINAIEIK
jgi:AcrR family transcriptional regulator